MIYLDNASTTRVFDQTVEVMNALYLDDFFNPSATYEGGRLVFEQIENSRQTLAEILGCKKEELYFTSCATESNNWVINNAFKNKKGNIVISQGEHACVYETAKALQSKGLEVRYAPLLPSGKVDIDKLISLVDDKTNLVSVIHASNETGVVNDISRICKEVKRKNPKTLVHSDGVQAFLKIQTSLKSLGVDFYSISGHKVCAPKGVGLLYINSSVHIAPYLAGGGQEKGMRSGTENVASIVGLAKSAQIYSKRHNRDSAKNLYNKLLSLISQIPDTTIIGDIDNNTNMIVCVSVKGVRAETLQSVVSDNGLYIGRGSACSSKHGGNRVLSAMGLSQQIVDGAIRLSIGVDTEEQDVLQAFEILKSSIEKLRGYKIG